jgi:hypothetical protein
MAGGGAAALADMIGGFQRSLERWGWPILIALLLGLYLKSKMAPLLKDLANKASIRWVGFGACSVPPFAAF